MSSPPTPVTSLSPALPNPAANLGWQIQGVPSGRTYAAESMTWDGADGYVLLFGGSNATGTWEGDTWTYLHGIWTELTPPVSPTGRDSTGLVYDATDNYVVLFGGYTPGSGGLLNDTWTFSDGVWTHNAYASTHGPSPRNSFDITFDSATGYVILFGGHAAPCNGNYTYQDCNDTWRYWYGGWQQLHPARPPPPAREQSDMTYDAADGYALLFGGYGPKGIVSSSNALGDTWFWNATGGALGNWTQVKTGGVLCGTQAEGKCPTGAAPPERWQLQLGFDAADNKVVLFGGYNNSVGTFGDTWTYSAGVWTQLAPATSAYGRWGGAMTFDAADNYLLLWGGGYIWYTPVDGVWKFAAGNWTEVGPGTGPPQVYGPSMAYDPVDGYVVFFGGYSPLTSSFLDQTWLYNSGVWTLAPLGPAEQPPARTWAAMTWDSGHGYILLFGGQSSTFALLNDTWAFVHGAWTELCAGSTLKCAPPIRLGAGLAYDPTDGLPILFGGDGPGILNDTWAWNGSAWIHEVSLTHAPSVRFFAGMTLDVADNEIVLFGGSNGTGALDDTWTLKSVAGGWTEVGICGGPGQLGCTDSRPSNRAGMIFAYDGADQVVVAAAGLYGGFGGSYQAYTYVFKAGVWYACPGYYCENGFPGWAPYIWLSGGAYDAKDGYVVVRGGLVPFGQFGGNSMSRDTWVFGHLISGPPPAETPYDVDMGQPTTLVASGDGGGFGTLSFGWNGIPGGCSPPFIGAQAFTCDVTEPGISQYYNYGVYGSYFVLDNVITDSNGWPGITTGDSNLNIAPTLKVDVNSSAAVADVGQVVYFGTNAVNGWGPFVYFWNTLPPGCFTVSTTYAATLVKCVLGKNAVGTWLPYATVVDSTGFNALSNSLTLTVNPSPNATGISVSTIALDAGQTLSVGVNPSGGSGTYTFNWSGVPSACLADAAFLSCVVPATDVGNYVPSVTLHDSNRAVFSESYSGTIVVSPDPTASGLAVTNATNHPTSAIDVGQSVTFTLTSTAGSGGDTVVWTGLPTGCSPTGSAATTVSCSPTETGGFSVSARVTDSNGVSATSPAAALSVSPALAGATIGASVSALDVGQSLTLTSSYSGGSGEVAFSWSGLPVGCFSSNSATVSCTPTVAGSSTPSVTIQDSNGAALHASVTAAIVVSAAPIALALSVTDQSGATVIDIAPGTTITFSLTSTAGSGGDTIVWTGLPAGCLASGTNAVLIECSPSAAGTYVVSARVNDSNGASATSPSVALTITAASAAAPFATSFQVLELGLLAVLVVLAFVLLLFVMFRPGRRDSGWRPPPPPAASGAGPTAPPPAGVDDPADYHET
ncbi:MAG TPA: kelch repeat-containing protein [Thermoplasmata archaeon]|nr:kelch repeat-containing protein [Thermoplasmata archaeon]